jgi:hypothetical protein
LLSVAPPRNSFLSLLLFKMSFKFFGLRSISRRRAAVGPASGCHRPPPTREVVSQAICSHNALCRMQIICNSKGCKALIRWRGPSRRSTSASCRHNNAHTISPSCLEKYKRASCAAMCDHTTRRARSKSKGDGCSLVPTERNGIQHSYKLAKSGCSEHVMHSLSTYLRRRESCSLSWTLR